jgi:hypothetical protein
MFGETHVAIQTEIIALTHLEYLGIFRRIVHDSSLERRRPRAIANLEFCSGIEGVNTDTERRHVPLSV